MQLQQSPKDFSNFVLLYLLDNLMNDSIAKKDNKLFSDIIDIMRKDSRYKIRIIKGFLKDISIKERGRYSILRKCFFDKNYTSGNSIQFIGENSEINKEKE